MYRLIADSKFAILICFYSAGLKITILVSGFEKISSRRPSYLYYITSSHHMEETEAKVSLSENCNQNTTYIT